MGEGAEHTTVEESTLALYLIGALEGADRAAFERHLAGCDRCLAEAGDLGGLTSALGLFSDADVAALLAEIESEDALSHATPARGRTADVPAAGGAVRPAVAAGTGARQRPPGRRDGAHVAATRRRRRLTAWAAAAAAVIALAITVIVVQGDGSPGGRPGGLVLVASAEARSGGVSLSISVTSNAHGSTAQVTISGLHPGVRYRLYAVTRDGATHVVRDWTGAAGTQQVTGELSQPVDSLAFFTVGQVDGEPIVTAPIQRGPGATPTR
jgi:hypothetical protein